MDLNDQLQTIVTKLKDLAAQVQPEQYGDKTPCATFTVRDLFGHLAAAAAIAPQLRGEPAPDGDVTVGDDPRVAVRQALDDLLAATRAPGAYDRTVTVPFGDIPGAVLVRFLTVDGMVHSWDIAQATGQAYSPPEGLVAEVLESARQLIAPEMRDGDTFAAEVVVPDDASSLTKLVAFTGRQP